MEIKLETDHIVKIRKQTKVSLEITKEMLYSILDEIKYMLPIDSQYLEIVIKDSIENVFCYSDIYHEQIFSKEDLDNMSDEEYNIDIKNIDEIVEYVKKYVPKDWISYERNIAVVTDKIFENKEERELFYRSTRDEQKEFILRRMNIDYKYNIRIIE